MVEEDLGANFFLDVDSVGKGRASCAVDLLVELNNEVKGFAIEENVGRHFKEKPVFFQPILGSDRYSNARACLARACRYPVEAVSSLVDSSESWDVGLRPSCDPRACHY